MLDVVDFGLNPDGPEFGEYGVVYVRHGKAKKGSPPKRRSVLAVWDWSAEVLQEWVEDIRPLFAPAGSPACWPSERGPRIGLSSINTRLAALVSGMTEHLPVPRTVLSATPASECQDHRHASGGRVVCPICGILQSGGRPSTTAAYRRAPSRCAVNIAMGTWSGVRRSSTAS